MASRPKLGDSLWLLYAYCLMGNTREVFTNGELAQLLRTTPTTIVLWQQTLVKAGAIEILPARRGDPVLVRVITDFLGPVHVKPRALGYPIAGTWTTTRVAPDVAAAIDKEFLKKCGIKEG